MVKIIFLIVIIGLIISSCCTMSVNDKDKAFVNDLLINPSKVYNLSCNYPNIICDSIMNIEMSDTNRLNEIYSVLTENKITDLCDCENYNYEYVYSMGYGMGYGKVKIYWK